MVIRESLHKYIYKITRKKHNFLLQLFGAKNIGLTLLDGTFGATNIGLIQFDGTFGAKVLEEFFEDRFSSEFLVGFGWSFV